MYNNFKTGINISKVLTNNGIKMCFKFIHCTRPVDSYAGKLYLVSLIVAYFSQVLKYILVLPKSLPKAAWLKISQNNFVYGIFLG